MRLRVSVLFLCAAVLILAGTVQAQTVTQTVDPAWMKTTNYEHASVTKGTVIKGIAEPGWTWTSTVWDGPQQNGAGTTIPGWVTDDFWAGWSFPYTSGVSQWWFKTTLDLPACTAALLSEVRLVNKYSPGALGINDDLYVWVNGAESAAGGAALASNVATNWSSKFIHALQSGTSFVETDGWQIANGLALLKEQFNAGSNQINVLTEDFAAWGGLAHVVFKVTQTGPCANIDIKPGSYPNCFNLNGSGVIPVAILGSGTFDATQVDPATLSFNGLAVRVKGNGAPQCSLQNVNADPYTDLVCQFVDDSSTWMGGTTTALLKGNLKNGTPFAGSDEICIVP